MFSRTWLVVLLGAAISVIVNSACAGFLSGVGLISLSSILFPPFYHKPQVHSSIMIGRDKNGKLKWRDQGVSGSVFLFRTHLLSIFFCLQVHPALQSCCLDSLVASSWNQLWEGAGGQEAFQIMTCNGRFCDKQMSSSNCFAVTQSFGQVEGHKAHFPHPAPVVEMHNEAGEENIWNIKYLTIEKYSGRRRKYCWILSTWELRNI